MRKMALVTCLMMTMALLASCGSSENRPDPLAVYENQTLAWQTCSENLIFRDALGESNIELIKKLEDRAKCAFMRAPLDYNDPSKGDVQIALLRVSAEDSQQRLGAIMFNPGGPGADGLYLSLVFGNQWKNAQVSDPDIKALYKQMSQSYDLVGFSPRGTGASTNLTCTSDKLFAFEASITVNDSQANWDNILYNSRLTAEICSKNPQTPYMNSESTARDMDLMRHLLGDSKFNYIGFSYGTWLGTWYAGLYPERVGRMMLVGNTDVTAPLNNILLQQGMGDQRVIDQVLVPYAINNPSFRLGSTTKEVKQAYLSFRTLPGYLLATTIEKLPISDSSKADTSLLYLRAAQMMQEYISVNPNADEATVKQWINATQFVDDVLNTQARALAIDLNKGYFDKVNQVTKPKSAVLTGKDALMWAVSCNDSGSSFGVDDWISENRISAILYPLYGGFLVRNACLYWGAPTVRRPPIEAVVGAGNILMLQSEFDPWTPVEGAMKTFTSLPNTSMILVQGEYTHALHIPYGLDCIDKPVAEYFLYGKQPQRLTKCAGIPLAAD